MEAIQSTPTENSSRLLSYYRKHGARSTCARCGAALRRSLYFGRMVLFSCPLPIKPFVSSDEIQFDRVDAATISKRDYESMLNVWNPVTRARQLSERFAAGSELWLARADDRLAGFGWTIKGRTIEPHFFPLRSDDVHLFDFFVFPEFRCRGINSSLVMEILSRLGEEKVRRAHIECAAWNAAQLRSLTKTELCRYAQASKIKLFGRLFVIWTRALVCLPVK